MEAPDFDAPPAAAPGGEASPGASSDDVVTVRTASPAGAAIATEASAEPAAARPAAAKPAKTPPSGNLAASLIELTDVIALESQKAISLECIGLHAVPAHYQTTVKNIAIQLIRNAVTHGIESADERLRAGKSAQGHLRLEFNATAAGTFDLMFEDDGRGLDPELVRKTAVARGLLDADAAAKMRDRQAIKLIFKSGFTTVRTGNAASGDTGRGSGLAVVRRHVHQAGGRIALASLPGHETRFKISMPSVPESAVEAQVA
jgi:signal transduction histidine kinase